MALTAGKVDFAGNFLNTDCMAKYIEDALAEPVPAPDLAKKERREFFIALAAGVINYLKVHAADSFVVKVQIENNTYNGTLEIL